MAMMLAAGGASGKRRRRRKSVMSDINVTPMVDVMLVLLIIFMVTATVITPGVINIPTAGKSQKAPDLRVDLLVDQAGQIGLAGELSAQDISEEDAVARIRQALAANPELPVMIAADSELRYQQVITLMRKLREAGVQRVGLSVK